MVFLRKERPVPCPVLLPPPLGPWQPNGEPSAQCPLLTFKTHHLLRFLKHSIDTLRTLTRSRRSRCGAVPIFFKLQTLNRRANGISSDLLLMPLAPGSPIHLEPSLPKLLLKELYFRNCFRSCFLFRTCTPAPPQPETNPNRKNKHPEPLPKPALGRPKPR